jgi:hypothetical protein
MGTIHAILGNEQGWTARPEVFVCELAFQCAFSEGGRRGKDLNQVSPASTEEAIRER